MREWNLHVGGRPARVWIGGREGRCALLLLHGGWGGAGHHWSPPWGPLAARFHVIAPELPGLSAGSPPDPRDRPGFAEWVEGLLDTLHLPTAWMVGNFFGPSLAWQVAATRAGRCLGLVLVSGGPPLHSVSRPTHHPVCRLATLGVLLPCKLTTTRNSADADLRTEGLPMA